MIYQSKDRSYLTDFIAEIAAIGLVIWAMAFFSNC